ncbi:MAG TPA: beta-ketoacyl-[acyl-carrier-protein] synthase family protein [Phycisphaerae bacterium]|nr:beta-ketoacyl-[acyl-carrier-protein] synthase family protein [Phycisphaerae bacterium]HRY68057.1 beta-ketoacyl-[acyl-carrier-protein] synthase family protein [Phycisphaerae bacterium]HSA28663.1 beta-ketoacyl-[acyl-carrier-protein] synthase family protein [Phycisphaerae bacterium]
MSSRRVVITGLGLVTPVGIGAETAWKALLEGKCGIRRIRAFDPSRFDSQVGGEIEGLNVAGAVPKAYRKSAKIMARDIEIAVVAAYEAAKDAGLKTRCLIERGEATGPSNLDPTRFGANIGAGLICADLTELAGALYTAVDERGQFSLRKWGVDGMKNLTPLWLLKFLPNMLSCHVTIVHDAQAPSNTITCAEAASHLAIGEAFRTVARGSADICICGGAESKLNPMGLMRQSLLKRLSLTHNDDPASACRPFDADRDGSVISEGGGLLIVEELEHARQRGARIYCELVGFGASTNTQSWLAPEPEGKGIALAIRKALQDAKVTANDVGLIATSGPGTVAHDLSEARGIRAALGDKAGSIPALAIKGAIGNNGAGSGAIDLAIAALCVRHQIIPPATSTKKVDPACGLNLVVGKPIEAKTGIAVSVAYALGGGQNAVLVLKRMED